MPSKAHQFMKQVKRRNILGAMHSIAAGYCLRDSSGRINCLRWPSYRFVPIRMSQPSITRAVISTCPRTALLPPSPSASSIRLHGAHSPLPSRSTFAHSEAPVLQRQQADPTSDKISANWFRPDFSRPEECRRRGQVLGCDQRHLRRAVSARIIAVAFDSMIGDALPTDGPRSQLSSPDARQSTRAG